MICELSYEFLGILDEDFGLIHKHTFTKETDKKFMEKGFDNFKELLKSIKNINSGS